MFNAAERDLIVRSIVTEVARVKRAINAATNQSIKEILQAEVVTLNSLEGRISVMEVEK